MAHPDPDFLPGRRLVLGAALAALATQAAAPVLADVGPDLLKGTVAKFAITKAPKALPDFEFTDADDKATKLSEFKGKPLIVNFWATWCAPCVKEMPSLDRLQAALGKNKALVLPLSLDGPSRPKVAPFYQDKNLGHLDIWFDKGRKAMQSLDVSILPTTILIDAAGREVGRLEGEADWDRPEAIALVTAALAG